MAEEIKAPAAPAAGDGKTAASTTTPPPAAAAPASAPARTALTVDDTGDDTAGDDTAGEETDWRTRYGDDADLQKLLARIASEQELGKKLVNQEKMIRSRAAKLPTLAEDATAEEIAAHRKALGIPEKAEEYGFAYPEGLTATENDTAALNAFADYMHKAGVPPAYAKAAFDFYVNTMQQGMTARDHAAEEAVLENMAQLRAEYRGKELGRNMKLADEYFLRHFGDEPETVDAINMVLDTRLPNGVKVMQFAPFMKGLFRAARATADDEALITSDIPGSGGKSLDVEKAELLAKSAAGRITKAEDQRLNQIYEAQAAKEARQGRGRAA